MDIEYLHGHFELPKLTPVLYFDIYSAILDIWTAYTDDWFQPVDTWPGKPILLLQFNE